MSLTCEYFSNESGSPHPTQICPALAASLTWVAGNSFPGVAWLPEAVLPDQPLLQVHRMLTPPYLGKQGRRNSEFRNERDRKHPFLITSYSATPGCLALRRAAVGTKRSHPFRKTRIPSSSSPRASIPISHLKSKCCLFGTSVAHFIWG
jgi:hypothetical protein